MGIKSKFARFFTEVDNRVGKSTRWKKMVIFADYYIGNKIHKIPMEEYFKYEFYLKNKSGKDEFCTFKKRNKFYDKFNYESDRKWFDDKALFAEKFKSFLGRDVIDMENVSIDEFMSFIGKHSKVILKQKTGMQGVGLQVTEIKNREEALKFFEPYGGQPYVAEEVIKQIPELAKFNDESLNSIRVMTFVKKNGDVDIIPFAALRIGRNGNVVDNFHYDGIAATIDSATGCVMTVGVDKNGNRWVAHPDSGELIVGFQIPYWDEICECVKKAAHVCEKVRFIGWDVAITEDGRVALIEGNTRSDPDVIQVTDGIGKWYLYQRYIDEENECR